ncbi:cadmium carbonic anhydrase [bacterium]|nr:cadmium carbonic anhydrase [bacterium]
MLRKSLVMVAALCVSALAHADDHAMHEDGALCEGFGPQTPRDIRSTTGSNPVSFPVAGPSTSMNLCNIHFHNAAEHAGPGFFEKASDREGYVCALRNELTPAQTAPFEGNACQDVQPGDTIEVHWVHTSCDVSPGPGLGSCLSGKCANPALRVETQVFTVVNDPEALDFTSFDVAGAKVAGKHQPKAIPDYTGTPVEFTGSTTGPSYTQSKCSALQVGWSVRPQCDVVSIQSLSKWCESNVFDEDGAHGVRKLVTAPELLSPITP